MTPNSRLARPAPASHSLQVPPSISSAGATSHSSNLSAAPQGLPPAFDAVPPADDFSEAFKDCSARINHALQALTHHNAVAIFMGGRDGKWGFLNVNLTTSTQMTAEQALHFFQQISQNFLRILQDGEASYNNDSAKNTSNFAAVLGAIIERFNKFLTHPSHQKLIREQRDNILTLLKKFSEMPASDYTVAHHKLMIELAKALLHGLPHFNDIEFSEDFLNTILSPAFVENLFKKNRGLNTYDACDRINHLLPDDFANLPPTRNFIVPQLQKLLSSDDNGVASLALQARLLKLAIIGRIMVNQQTEQSALAQFAHNAENVATQDPAHFEVLLWQSLQSHFSIGVKKPDAIIAFTERFFDGREESGDKETAENAAIAYFTKLPIPFVKEASKSLTNEKYKRILSDIIQREKRFATQNLANLARVLANPEQAALHGITEENKPAFLQNCFAGTRFAENAGEYLSPEYISYINRLKSDLALYDQSNLLLDLANKITLLNQPVETLDLNKVANALANFLLEFQDLTQKVFSTFKAKSMEFQVKDVRKDAQTALRGIYRCFFAEDAEDADREEMIWNALVGLVANDLSPENQAERIDALKALPFRQYQSADGEEFRVKLKSWQIKFFKDLGLGLACSERLIAQAQQQHQSKFSTLLAKFPMLAKML